MPGIKSFGTTISYDGTVIGGVESINRSGGDRNMIDITTQDDTDGFKKFIGGLRDAGTCEITGNYIIGDAGQTKLRNAEITDEAKSVIITFSDGSTITFNAFPMPPDDDAPLDDKVTFKASLKITGKATYSD